MKIILKLIALIALAMLIAILNKIIVGQITVLTATYRLDISLVAGVLCLSIAFIVFYYLVRLISHVTRLPNTIRVWRMNNLILKSRKFLNTALMNYFEGKYKECYKNAFDSLSNQNNKDSKFLALMLAYKSAVLIHDQQDEQKAWSELNAYRNKKWDSIKHIALAEAYYLKRQYSMALENLNRALSQDNNLIQAWQLVFKLYYDTHNFAKALDALNWLSGHQVFDNKNANYYKCEILKGVFEQVEDLSELKHYYMKLQEEDKSNVFINKNYFLALIRLNSYKEGLEFLKANSYQLLPSVIDNLISLARSIEDVKLINFLFEICNECLSYNEIKYKLHLILGVLSYKLGNLIDSERFLEQSIKLKPNVLSYFYLSVIANSSSPNISSNSTTILQDITFKDLNFKDLSLT